MTAEKIGLDAIEEFLVDTLLYLCMHIHSDSEPYDQTFLNLPTCSRVSYLTRESHQTCSQVIAWSSWSSLVKLVRLP